MMKKLSLPLTKGKIKNLKIGDELLLSGIIYTARDKAHQHLVTLIKNHKKLPIDLKNQIIYYCGPTAKPKNKIIGSCGPTTSSRMDKFTPILLKKGLSGIIGKGNRSKEVVDAIKKYKAIYFLTYAGCGALLTRYIKKAKVLAFSGLGPEAILKLEVKDFPVIIGIDSLGKNIYKSLKVPAYRQAGKSLKV
ncbi:MAG: FumA C-terminus/TtdB family hydratase beta subunit [Candidatus Omnitrophota bacterium]